MFCVLFKDKLLQNDNGVDDNEIKKKKANTITITNTIRRKL